MIHSIEVGFTLRAQAARVRITAPESYYVAVLIDSKDSREKALTVDRVGVVLQKKRHCS